MREDQERAACGAAAVIDGGRSATRPGTTAQIMVIDDDPAVRDWLADCLGRAGFSVLMAVDGVDALHHLRGESPDLILCDVRMPRLDGYQTLLKYRSLPHLRATPFVLMSADAATASQAVPEGAADFWAKPFDRAQLECGVRALLGV